MPSSACSWEQALPFFFRMNFDTLAGFTNGLHYKYIKFRHYILVLDIYQVKTPFFYNFTSKYVHKESMKTFLINSLVTAKTELIFDTLFDT